jgi:DNA-binding MarR family transcriptional regulator
MAADTLYPLLERISNLLRAESRDAAAELGLQPVHLAALDYLARANRYSDTPRAVGEYLELTKGTVSQSLQVLEREGLITKQPDPNDKRVVHLAVSADGKKALQQVVAKSLLHKVARNLSAGRLSSTEAGLKELLLGFQRARRSRAFGVCHTCRFFTTEATGFRCGLTHERLSVSDSQKICREQETQETSTALA